MRSDYPRETASEVTEAERPDESSQDFQELHFLHGKEVWERIWQFCWMKQMKIGNWGWTWISQLDVRSESKLTVSSWLAESSPAQRKLAPLVHTWDSSTQELDAEDQKLRSRGSGSG